MAYTQKWCLVSFLEPVNIGAQFGWKQWPLHVTLAGVLAVDWTDALLHELRELAAQTSPLEVNGVSEVYWGAQGEYHCVLLEKTAEISSLHEKILEILQAHGAVFNDPEFVGDGYLPHSTIQRHARVDIGQTVELRSLSIIDMFPGGDHERRLVKQTISLGAAY